MKIDSVSRLIVNPQPTGKSGAELGISESMKSQENALTQGSKNLQDAVSLGQTAEGALNSVTDSLQQIRELTIQAKNATYTADDKGAIQDQISNLLKDVQGLLKNTEFNTIKLFDGGFSGNIQGGGESQGRMMQIENTSLSTLGLADFDITKGSGIEEIDKALNKVSDSRSQIGTQTRVFESAIRSNEIARENTLASRSRMDEDFVKQVSALKRLQITQQYHFQLQQKQQVSQLDKLNILT